MSDVKRQYHSPRRAAQALSTRRAILRAAGDLFLAEGYSATTVNAIAQEADVAPQTIYSQFGTKAAIAKEMLDVSIVGDDEPVPVADRPWFACVFDDGITGRERLQRYASAVRRIYAGAGKAFEIVRRGADGDPELAELWRANQAARRAVVTQIVDGATSDTPLRPGLSKAEAVDLLWVLHGPELFHLLTVECGWSTDRYETWLADAFCEQILGVLPSDRRKAGRRSAR